jgi:hypothetical protein
MYLERWNNVGSTPRAIGEAYISPDLNCCKEVVKPVGTILLLQPDQVSVGVGLPLPSAA